MQLIPSKNRNGITVIAVGGVAGFFCVVLVILRMWACRLKGLKLDSSDWTCVASLVGIQSQNL
jgi:hypothetical protein